MSADLLYARIVDAIECSECPTTELLETENRQQAAELLFARGWRANSTDVDAWLAIHIYCPACSDHMGRAN